MGKERVEWKRRVEKSYSCLREQLDYAGTLD